MHGRRGRARCSPPSGASPARSRGSSPRLALALTPITIAVARVNNPDALLVLLLVLSAYLTVRAIESGRGKWLYWAGAVVGLAFMTKMLQGWMVVPALGAGLPRRRRRRGCSCASASWSSPCVVMVAVSCAWPLAVTLWPGAKPYIGGSHRRLASGT